MSSESETIAEMLIVEDDRDCWDIARRAFNRAGVADFLHIVGSGEDALKFLRRCKDINALAAPRQPRVVLMDLNMPGMGGIEAVRAIKQDADLRSIPVVVFSTSSKPTDVRKAYAAGANSFVEKPVDFVEYVQTAERICDYWLRLAETPE